ncbi:cyclase [Acaryochloris sp. 'Moss Beach']|uniref:SRPBCC family protein n=1 Tax=Acaryochloris sp. 'Moss Beach' TaxID=2740837 RepID=UPI001F3DBDFE|nr:SRPBCC family protein [Acaryochloris sp. 'Moss Beach']UJB71196.1 cyclase [Acaryochloris sp. 'Moss Beach']
MSHRDPVMSVPAAAVDPTHALLSPQQMVDLLQGKILLDVRSHTHWGGAVTATMYLPRVRSHIWSQLTTYSRWVRFFPDIVKSEVLEHASQTAGQTHRLYQAARKTFFLLSVDVEIFLKVSERFQENIKFSLERGSFSDFSADLTLQDCGEGTILTYSVAATPLIPMPSIFIQEAIRADLPGNMKHMRQALCS